jgi:crossover junction endodeoxyribonuclease RusA
MKTIVMPFPPSSLSGHAKGHWRGKAAETRRWRDEAWGAALEAGARKAKLPDGDIALAVRFVPPDRRSDRTNLPNRMKPIFDGIADALKVNDRRYLRTYEFAGPETPGRVEIMIGSPR